MTGEKTHIQKNMTGIDRLKCQVWVLDKLSATGHTPFPKSEVASSPSVGSVFPTEGGRGHKHLFDGSEASCPDHSPFLVFYHSERSEGFRNRWPGSATYCLILGRSLPLSLFSPRLKIKRSCMWKYFINHKALSRCMLFLIFL